ncbi:hypothetical protein ACFQ2M_39890 [Kitasatospora saccharophila]
MPLLDLPGGQGEHAAAVAVNVVIAARAPERRPPRSPDELAGA